MAEVVASEALKRADARPKRTPVQQRGRQRVDAILDAAELVISEMGVEAATTNAIAERAGSSVGSLYHFFPNKDAIIVALAGRFAESMTAILQHSRRLDEPWVPLHVLFTDMIQAYLAMNAEHPAYLAVCRATDNASGGKSQISLQTEQHMQAMVQELLAQRCPGIPAHESARHAALSVVSVHAVLDHVCSIPQSERAGLCEALVDMMVRYFMPVEQAYPRR